MSKTLENVLFISMNGDSKAAIEFYKKHLEAKVEMLVTYEDIAKSMPGFKLTLENRNYISHSVMKIGNSKLMIAEETMDPSEKYLRGNNFSMCIQSGNLNEIEGFYKSLTADERVRVIVPLGSNVFSEAYGILEDPFGVQIQLMFDQRLRY